MLSLHVISFCILVIDQLLRVYIQSLPFSLLVSVSLTSVCVSDTMLLRIYPSLVRNRNLYGHD